MSDAIQFNKIKSKEEFFLVFRGLCEIAESAFNKFDAQFQEVKREDAAQVRKGVSYLMSITFVVMGMRGDYDGFRDENLSTPFFVEIDGVHYDQKYLYTMNDYFADRFNTVLNILKEVDLESYASYNVVWKNH